MPFEPVGPTCQMPFGLCVCAFARVGGAHGRGEQATLVASVGATEAGSDQAIWCFARTREAISTPYLIGERGGILRCDEPGRFDIFIAAKSIRKSFSVQNTAGHWKVTEVSQSPHDCASALKPQPITLPDLLLTYLGPLTLQFSERSPESPIRNVRNFTFDGNGQIAFLRDDGEAKPPTFVLVDQTGKLLHEIPVTVSAKPDSQWTGCVWVGGSRFVISNSDPGPANVAGFLPWNFSTDRLSELQISTAGNSNPNTS